MFDLLNFIHHIKMLSELSTLTLFRVDTFTICVVIWMYCKNWGLSETFAQQFLQLKYQDHRDYWTQKQKQGCNVAIQSINIFPKLLWFSLFYRAWF